MNEPLNPSIIFAHMQTLGISNHGMQRIGSDNGWRIRADGGLVIRIYDDGKLHITGKNARVLRKALGLTGRRHSCCTTPLKAE
jgi:hypothetical protein